MDKALSEIRKSQFIVIDLTGARTAYSLRLVLHLALALRQFMFTNKMLPKVWNFVCVIISVTHILMRMIFEKNLKLQLVRA